MKKNMEKKKDEWKGINWIIPRGNGKSRRVLNKTLNPMGVHVDANYQVLVNKIDKDADLSKLYDDSYLTPAKVINKVKKTPSLTDKELKKWSDILGPSMIKTLYIQDKIKLTSAQLEEICKMDDKEVKKELIMTPENFSKFMEIHDEYKKTQRKNKKESK